jgi:hypothetical protein
MVSLRLSQLEFYSRWDYLRPQPASRGRASPPAPTHPSSLQLPLTQPHHTLTLHPISRSNYFFNPLLHPVSLHTPFIPLYHILAQLYHILYLALTHPRPTLPHPHPTLPDPHSTMQHPCPTLPHFLPHSSTPLPHSITHPFLAPSTPSLRPIPPTFHPIPPHP